MDSQPAAQILEAYHTLGLSPGQDEKKVKEAYRTLARALHPDRNPEAQVSMAVINQAYNILLEYFKNAPPPPARKKWLLPFSRLRRDISLHLSSWLGAKPRRQVAEQPVIKEVSGGEGHWLLRDISREGPKLVYKVEVFGNPKGLALPLRRRRPCRVCQGSGKIWEQGSSNICGNCGGRGYITKPVSISVALPDHWEPGHRITLESSSLSGPLEVELRRPNQELALVEHGFNK